MDENYESDSSIPSGSPKRTARTGGLLSRVAPALLAGAALAVTTTELVDPGRYPRVQVALCGALYGVIVRILVRAFPVEPRLRPLAGLAVGALPFAIFLARSFPVNERLGIGLGLSLMGALIGALDRES